MMFLLYDANAEKDSGDGGRRYASSAVLPYSLADVFKVWMSHRPLSSRSGS